MYVAFSKNAKTSKVRNASLGITQVIPIQKLTDNAENTNTKTQIFTIVYGTLLKTNGRCVITSLQII